MTKLYLKLAEELETKIKKNYYVFGQKLPSIRTLVEEKQVSISTVQEAYRRLEDKHLIYSKPQSGYFVNYRQDKPTSATTTNPAQRPVEVGKWSIVNNVLNVTDVCEPCLSQAHPSLSFNTLKPLQKNIASQIMKNLHESLGPSNISGNIDLRKQISRLMFDCGCQIDSSQITITNGCIEAIHCALRALTKPGDLVAIDSPCYFGYMQTLASLGLKVIEIPTNSNDGMSLIALKKSLEKWPIKTILVNPTIHNPLGYTMPAEKRQKIYTIAQEFDITIIEDDVYSPLLFDAKTLPAIKSFDKDGRVIYCSSFSKTISYGIRLGWCVSGKYFDNIAQIKYTINSSSNSLMQKSIAWFIQKNHYQQHLIAARKYYKNNHDLMINLLDQFMPEGYKVNIPHGGYLLWIEFPDEVNTLILRQILLDKHQIGIAPGTLFSATGKYHNCMRINYVNEINPQLINNIKTIGKVAEQLMLDHLVVSEGY